MDSGGQGATLVVSFVLAGILGPRAYGLVAMALVYVLFVELVQQQGMQAAVIQRAHLSRGHLDTAFWLVVVSSLLLTAASVGLSGWWSELNRQPDLQPVLVALSALLPIRALAVVQEGVMRRDLRFRGLAGRTLTAVTVGGVAGIVAAVSGLGVWALVIQQLATAAVGCLLLWVVSDWRPGLRFSFRAGRDLLGFSTGSFVSSLGVFVNNKADAILMGLFFGPLAVGIYRLGAKLVDALATLASRPIRSVALPALSQHQDHQGRFDRRLLQLTSVTSWVAIPLLGLLAGSAHTVVALLGPEWEPTVWPLRLLCLVGVARVLVNLDGPMLQAAGHVRVLAVTTWVTAAASAGAFVSVAGVLQSQSVGAQVVGVAATRVAVVGTLVLGLHIWLVRRYTRLSVTELLGTSLPPLAAGFACAVAAAGVDLAAGVWNVPLVVRVLALGAIGVVTAVVVIRPRLQALHSIPATGSGADARGTALHP